MRRGEMRRGKERRDWGIIGKDRGNMRGEMRRRAGRRRREGKRGEERCV